MKPGEYIGWLGMNNSFIYTERNFEPQKYTQCVLV